MRTYHRIAANLVAVVLTIGIIPSVSASPSFPNAIRDELTLATSPPCTTCHVDPSGGFGTAETAFAKYLRSRGLKAGDLSSLSNSLAAATGEQDDADGDGATDIDELHDGTDPNSGSGAVPDPEFGCQFKTLGPRTPTSSTLTILCLVAFLSRKRRWSC